MTVSKPYGFSETTPPNTVTWEVRTATYEFQWAGDTFRPQHAAISGW